MRALGCSKERERDKIRLLGFTTPTTRDATQLSYVISSYLILSCSKQVSPYYCFILLLACCRIGAAFRLNRCHIWCTRAKARSLPTALFFTLYAPGGVPVHGGLASLRRFGAHAMCFTVCGCLLMTITTYYGLREF
jgi:hypothetical protein